MATAVLLFCLGWIYGLAGAFQGEISIGQEVVVATGGSALNLRQNPGTDEPVVAKLSNGTVMTVVGGPQSAGNYQWWELDGTPGRGWAAANWLRPASDDTLVPGAPASAQESAVESGCSSPNKAYPGITHCTRDNSNTHVVVIDLEDPHVRFETVLAYDAANTEVRPYNKQTVEGMVAGYPGVVAAINADYFGDPHGPEGLTVKNGRRLDGPDVNDEDGNAVYRSALAIGRTVMDPPGGKTPIQAEIIRLQEDDQQLDFDDRYNVVGGGPQIVFDGAWEWKRNLPNPRYRSCYDDIITNDIINGECFRDTGDWDNANKKWTAVGLTGDNQMIWVLGLYPDIQDALAAFDTRQAIKLDGGGSSQLWFNGWPVESGRPVVDSLMVFYLRAASIEEQPRWRVIMENESLDVKLTLRNIGSDFWPGDTVALVNSKNPFGAPERQPLSGGIGPGGTYTWQWETDPFDSWGIYNSQWALAYGDETFPGQPVSFSVVVLPAELAEKKAELEQQLNEWLAEGKENMEQLILEWIRGLLSDNGICLPIGLVLPGILALVGVGYRGRKIKR